MPVVCLDKRQTAKHKQERLYGLIVARRENARIEWQKIAEACDESKQTFQYRFKNRKLEPWELMIVCDVIGITDREVIEHVN